MYSIEDMVKATGGQLLQKGRMDSSARVCIDSRIVGKGDVFFAVKGDRFDGHDFVELCVRAGVHAFFIS